MTVHSIPVREHDMEPMPGLPGQLPDGEFIVWQGRPDSATFAKRVMKTRWVLGYFCLLGLWAVAAGMADAKPLAGVLFSAGVLAILAALVLGLMEAFAWGVEKTTLYTITNARVVMRIGVALSITLNLPFSQIEAVGLKRNPDGSGNLAIKLTGGQRLAWLTLWPHARPWHLKEPEPTLRAIAKVETVAALLAREVKNAVPGETRAPKATGRTQAPVRPERVAEALAS